MLSWAAHNGVNTPALSRGDSSCYARGSRRNDTDFARRRSRRWSLEHGAFVAFEVARLSYESFLDVEHYGGDVIAIVIGSKSGQIGLTCPFFRSEADGMALERAAQVELGLVVGSGPIRRCRAVCGMLPLRYHTGSVVLRGNSPSSK